MRFDLTKIDDRIRKIQEVRRIVSDPEMAQCLLEALTAEDAVLTPQDVVDATLDESKEPSGAEEADLIIKEAIQSSGADALGSSSPFWSRQRK